MANKTFDTDARLRLCALRAPSLSAGQVRR